jgi:creatinine amidohydrolase/Fe(II)-dependent formamide hydrolase-like protein
MRKKTMTLTILLGLSIALLSGQDGSRAIILQELSWAEAETYFKSNDMVIVPLGSTEQHGPHLPLGTDYYEALGISQIISEQTGVLVVPVIFAGYSEYHSGFPGTLSIKPETMEQILFECVEFLIGYGISKIMFFNYHGGNNIVQERLIHRINHNTEAIALAIGVGSSLQQSSETGMDWHAGVSETSIMLHLRPDLVKIENARKPVMHFTSEMEALQLAAKKNPELLPVWNSLFGVPLETKKGGTSHELTSNGVWSDLDPNNATAEFGKQHVDKMVEKAVKLIEAWRSAVE